MIEWFLCQYFKGLVPNLESSFPQPFNGRIGNRPCVSSEPCNWDESDPWLLESYNGLDLFICSDPFSKGQVLYNYDRDQWEEFA